jgi:hypothetical protein
VLEESTELTPKKAALSRRFPKGKNPGGAVLDARDHYLRES